MSTAADRLRFRFLTQVWNQTGFPGRAPPVYSHPMRGDWGEQDVYSRRVTLDPGIAQALAGMASGGRRDEQALKVLLHEYAHVAQPRVFRRPIVEGGAEAWAGAHVRPIANRLFGPDIRGSLHLPTPTVPAWMTAYPAWTRRISPYTRERSQFGRR